MSSWTSGYVADTGYTYGFYPEMTPCQAHLALTLQGVQSCLDPDKPFTYCELGFGQGMGLNLLAAAYPHASFYGTDFNPSHAAEATRVAEAAQLANLHIYDLSFGEFIEADDLPCFDMIALHGIYSWVSPEVRAQIVAFLRKKLKVGGVVYISYNCAPGWAVTLPLRDILYRLSQRSTGDGVSRMTQGLATIQRLLSAQDLPLVSNPALRTQLEQLSKGDPRYQAHEFLNSSWNLFHFQDVAAELSEAKLSFATSATLLRHVEDLCHPPEARALLAQEADVALRETFRDFLLNTQFRRDFFVRGPVPLSAPERMERLLNHPFHFLGHLKDLKLTHTFPIGEITLDEGLYRTLAEALAQDPVCLGDLLQHPRLRNEGPHRLLQAILVLCALTQATPSLSATHREARQASCTRLNASLAKASLSHEQYELLVSPISGIALRVLRSTQNFLHAYWGGAPDPAAAAARTLFDSGQRLKQEGRTLETFEETLQAFRTFYETGFSDGDQALFRRHGLL